MQLILSGCLLLLGASSLVLAAPPRLNGPYEATAYAQKGITASGQLVHPHVVAADPDVLPIGSRIKIRRAGRYSGEYVVADTGEKIQGRRLDIYLPSVLACKKFGTKVVVVKVIQLGDGTHQSAKEADRAVKRDVQKDVVNNIAGDAATAVDVGAKPAASTSTTSTQSTTVRSTAKPDKPIH
jgi:3D (Asp-Asp-Asp) domain-containing protein